MAAFAPLPRGLPSQWPTHVRSGLLHAIALAATALQAGRGRASRRRDHQLHVDLDQAKAEIALLREEVSIKDARWRRSRTRRRPYYRPIERMRILQLRAARGWTIERTARVFLLDELTFVLPMLDDPGLAWVRGVGPSDWWEFLMRMVSYAPPAVTPDTADWRMTPDAYRELSTWRHRASEPRLRDFATLGLVRTRSRSALHRAGGPCRCGRIHRSRRAGAPPRERGRSTAGRTGGRVAPMGPQWASAQRSRARPITLRTDPPWPRRAGRDRPPGH